MADALGKEIAAFEALLPTLLATRRGEVVLIQGAHVVGFFTTMDEALRAGYERFGLDGSFLVEEVTEQRPAVFASSLVRPPSAPG